MPRLVDSYSESNYSQDRDVQSTPGGPPVIWQTFNSVGGIIDSCKFYLKKNSGATGNATARIYAHSGVFGSTGVYTGAVLATSDNFDISTLTTSYQLATFNFSGANRITLPVGTKYCLALYNNNAGIIYAGRDNTSPTHEGNAGYDYGGAAYESTTDMCFYLYFEGTATKRLTLLGVG